MACLAHVGKSIRDAQCRFDERGFVEFPPLIAQKIAERGGNADFPPVLGQADFNQISRKNSRSADSLLPPVSLWGRMNYMAGMTFGPEEDRYTARKRAYSSRDEPLPPRTYAFSPDGGRRSAKGSSLDFPGRLRAAFKKNSHRSVEASSSIAPSTSSGPREYDRHHDQGRESQIPPIDPIVARVDLVARGIR